MQFSLHGASIYASGGNGELDSDLFTVLQLWHAATYQVRIRTMEKTLSKTAKKSMQVETTGAASRIPLAWVFERRLGKMRYRPYAVCYVRGQAEEIVSRDPENLFVVAFDERRK